jgi:hypothetical protein
LTRQKGGRRGKIGLRVDQLAVRPSQRSGRDETPRFGRRRKSEQVARRASKSRLPGGRSRRSSFVRRWVFLSRALPTKVLVKDLQFDR